MKKGLLIVVSGPSGVGKGTVCKKLTQHHEHIFLSVSATTRKPRAQEVEGENYYFMSKEAFLSLEREGGLLEYAEYVGNYYGTPIAPLQQKLDAGKDVVLEIELKGAMLVKQKWKDALFIFLLPPDMLTLRDRIEKRGTEDTKTINERMAKSMKEMNYVHEYDYVVVNHDVEDAAENIAGIIQAEKQRVYRNQELIEHIRRSL